MNNIPQEIIKYKVTKKYQKIPKSYVVEHFNKLGYYLYYINNNQLIEIEDIRKYHESPNINIAWKALGDFIIFLNQDEYDKYSSALNNINKLKEIYDKKIELMSHHVIYSMIEKNKFKNGILSNM